MPLSQRVCGILVEVQKRWLSALVLAACNFRPEQVAQDATRVVDTALHDAGDHDDTGHADAGCTSIASGSAALAVPEVSVPPTIDGEFDDWDTCFIELDGSNSQLTFGSAGYVTGQFAAEWNGDTLYLAAEVVGGLPLGSGGLPDIYLNNSVEFYIDADGIASGSSYDAHTAQLVVDHNNAQHWFVDGNATTLPSVVTAVALGSDPTSYHVEVALPASALGSASFASPFGFDFDWVNGNGSSQLSRVTWAQTCASCTADPCCDAREFGSATLVP